MVGFELELPGSCILPFCPSSTSFVACVVVLRSECARRWWMMMLRLSVPKPASIALLLLYGCGRFPFRLVGPCALSRLVHWRASLASNKSWPCWFRVRA